MKTFEEQWTAWIDGQLSGKELADFEALLPDKAAAEAERTGAQQLGTLLKRELGANMLTNEDFFNHQLRERIARETRDAHPSEDEAEAPVWWTIRRLLWGGAAALAMFVVLAVVTMQSNNPTEQSEWTTTVLRTQLNSDRTGPGATVSLFDTKEEKVTVIWTEGLNSLPADYAAK